MSEDDSRRGPRRPPRPAGPADGDDAAGETSRPTPELPGPRPAPRRRAQPAVRTAPPRSSARFRETSNTPAVPVEPVDMGVDRVDPVDPAPSVGSRRIGLGPLTGRFPKIERAPRPDPAELLPEPPSPRTAFRQRYGVPYNTFGPRVRLGVLWAIAVAFALAFRPLRPYGLATLYAVVAGAAAMQVVDAWEESRGGANRWVAALGASTLPVVATLGVRPLGITLLAVVVAALVLAPQRTNQELPFLAAAGHTVLAVGLCGGAAASLVLLADYEIGAVIILLVLVMAYDASDYVVGSGSPNGLEGPIAGWLSIAAVTTVFAVINAPPFRGVDIWTFSILAALACPAGQLLASAMLPTARSNAPALRRLDSLLLVAPAWAGLVGLYIHRMAG